MTIFSFMEPVKFGGGEKLMFDLACYFKEKNIKLVIVLLTRSKEFEIILKKKEIDFITISNITLPPTPSKKYYFILFFRLLPYLFRIRKILNKEKFDRALVSGFPAVFLVALANIFKPKRKFIYIHHSIKSKENSLIRRFYLFFLKKYHKIVAVSSQTQESLINVFPEIKEKIVFVPNGINCKNFETKEDKYILRKKLNLPAGIIGICVGRLAFFKNQKFLIEVAKEIKRNDFHILIIGDGEEFENLKNTIHKENLEKSVSLLGFKKQEEIPYYLKASDIFLYPSLKEGFGIVILEAMAAGLPVVIFKDIYTKEFGEDVLIAGTEKEFIQHTKKLIENEPLRKNLGEKLKNYAQELDIKNTARKYLEIL